MSGDDVRRADERRDELFRQLGSWLPSSPRARRWHARDRGLSERWLALTPLHPLFWARVSLRREVRVAVGARGGTILDLGCGDAPYRRFLRATTYFGVDVAPASAADVRADLAALPFPDRCADIVLCTEVLEHVPDPETCAQEIARVLAPGGIAICTVPFAFPVHDYHDYRRLTARGLSRLAETAGLKVRAVRPLTGSGPTLAMLTNLFLFDLACYWKRRFYLLSIALRPAVWAATVLINALGWLAGILVPSTHLPFGYLMVAESRAGGNHSTAAIACPACRGRLHSSAAAVTCDTCARTFPVEHNTPVLVLSRARVR